MALHDFSPRQPDLSASGEMYVQKGSFYHLLYMELGKCRQKLQSETHHFGMMDLKDHPLQKNESQCQCLKAVEIPGEVLF